MDNFYLERIILPIGYWENGSITSFIIPVLLVVLFSISAILLMKEKFEEKSKKYTEEFLSNEKRFSFAGDMKTLLAKEFLELKRSGSVRASYYGIYGPVLGIFFIVSLFENKFRDRN